MGVPYTQEMIENASDDAFGQSAPDEEQSSGVTKRYGKATQVRAFDGEAGRLTEMDALVAYLQVLGKLTDAAQRQASAAQVTAR